MLLIAEFVYNSMKNISISYNSFKLNYYFYLRVSYKENVNFYLKLKIVDRLAAKQKQLINFYYKNL